MIGSDRRGSFGTRVSLIYTLAYTLYKYYTAVCSTCARQSEMLKKLSKKLHRVTRNGGGGERGWRRWAGEGGGVGVKKTRKNITTDGGWGPPRSVARAHNVTNGGGVHQQGARQAVAILHSSFCSYTYIYIILYSPRVYLYMHTKKTRKKKIKKKNRENAIDPRGTHAYMRVRVSYGRTKKTKMEENNNDRKLRFYITV